MDLLEIRVMGKLAALKFEGTDNRWLVCRMVDGFGPGMDWKFEAELNGWTVVYTKED